MPEQFKYLFAPIKIGPITVKNRIAYSPHGTGYCQNGLPLERLAYFLSEKAKGGAGVIGVEGIHAVPEPTDVSLAAADQIRGYDERCILGFRLVAEMAHEHGAKVFSQIMNMGIWSGRGASMAPDMRTRVTGREATVEEIAAWVRYYGVTAINLRKAGIDGLEIHASHGTGAEQFLSPLYNRRTDKYGGSLEKRMTFLLEIIDSIRQAVGNDMALGVRLNVEEPTGGITLPDGQRIAQLLEATGKVDYLSVDTAMEPHQAHLMVAPMYAPHGHMVYSAAAVKEVVERIPVIAAGRIIDPLFAEKVLADGHADLVAMTRAQIADPELANKAREGRLDDIRPCLGDNENCIGRRLIARPLACTVNPAVGEEKELGIGTITPARIKRKVLVVGGGPAGMEAARVAALRGHHVVLYEREQALGGQVNLAALLPGRSEIGGIVRWLTGQLYKLGVEIHLGKEATAAGVEKVRADAAVIATGASYFRNGLSPQTIQPIAGWQHDHVVIPEDLLSGRKTAGQRVIVVDQTGFIVGPGIAEWLSGQGRAVELLTSDPYIGSYLVPNVQLPWVYARIMSKITLTPNTVVKEIAGRTVVTVNPYSGLERRIEGVDTVVLITAKELNDGLYRELAGRLPELHRVGDCDHAVSGVFGIGDAIRSGHRIGRKI